MVEKQGTFIVSNSLEVDPVSTKSLLIVVVHQTGVMEISLLEDCHPLMSKVYFVETLFAKVQTHGLDLLNLLKLCEGFFVEPSLEKIKHMGYEKPLDIVSKAIKDQIEGCDCSSDKTSLIADLLSLKSNQELLIELVALETIKENDGQSEYIEEMISLVTQMHDRFVEIKQSQNNPVPIPPDFCCPLSLELMADPVIVSSGQTYEHGYITNWINLGLTICPKTMQTLHTNLTPNYIVKTLIENWWESNKHFIRLNHCLATFETSAKAIYFKNPIDYPQAMFVSKRPKFVGNFRRKI